MGTCGRAVVVLIGVEFASTRRQQPPFFAVAKKGNFERGPPLLHPWQKSGSRATMRGKKDKSGPDGHGVDDKHYTSFVMIGFLY